MVTREQVLEWLCEKLDIRNYRNLGDSGAIHRLEWIALEVAHFRRWSLDDIEAALKATESVKPVTRRIYDIHHFLTFRTLKGGDCDE